MKTVLHRLLLTALLAACTSASFAAPTAVPSGMAYQGFLTNESGDPIAQLSPENRDIEFRVYDVASGGTALWGEKQTVTVYKGNFSVILGNGSTIGAASTGPAEFTRVFTNAAGAPDGTGSLLYFGITPVASPAASEFSPRQRLVSSAFAFRARVAEQVNAQDNTSPALFNSVNAVSLALSGKATIQGNNTLELGAGATKGTAADGTIGYKTYSLGLDIVGAGTLSDYSDRKITMHAQGGTDFLGPINLPFYGQAINLKDGSNGIGVQNLGVYMRAFSQFAWYRGGAHNDGGLNSGGGTTMATLTPTGFALSEGRFIGDGSGLTNLPAPSTVNNLTLGGTITKTGHGPFINSFSESHVFGSQQHTTYTRTSRNFAWYKGGTHNDNEFDAGGGSELMRLTSDGLQLTNGLYIPNSPLSFGQRTAQHINLWSTTDGFGIQNSRLYSRTGAGFSWFVGGTHSDATSDPGSLGGTPGTTIADWTVERAQFNRRVYINTGGTNSQAPSLDVNGGSNSFTYAGGSIARFYRAAGGNTGYDTTTTAASVSIRASDAIEGNQFIAKSDRRLKLAEGVSNAARDLETLSALEVTDYKMKDRSTSGERPFKKLIAQQVEAVYPQAVSTSTGVVPDIYRKASANSGFIAFMEAGKTELQVGDIVRLVGNGWDLKSEVTESGDQGFRVKDAVKEGELFVYGREVRDLRSLDYEAISMLNVSATQELARRLRLQAETIARLETEKAQLQKQLAQQDQRLSAVERLIKAGAVPVTYPAVQKTAAK